MFNWYLKMLKFALPPTRTLKFALPSMRTPNVSQWNKGGVFWPWGTRWPCTFHVVCVKYYLRWVPNAFSVEYGLESFIFDTLLKQTISPSIAYRFVASKYVRVKVSHEVML